jgi:hypothetical protein
MGMFLSRSLLGRPSFLLRSVSAVASAPPSSLSTPHVAQQLPKPWKQGFGKDVVTRAQKRNYGNFYSPTRCLPENEGVLPKSELPGGNYLVT